MLVIQLVLWRGIKQVKETEFLSLRSRKIRSGIVGTPKDYKLTFNLEVISQFNPRLEVMNFINLPFYLAFYS